MKTISFVLLAMLLVFGFAALFHTNTQAKSDKQLRESMIVSTEWLAQHLKDDDLVLLQVGDKDEYTAAHLPRAQFIQIADISTPRGQGLILELPPVEQLKATFDKLGVTDKSHCCLFQQRLGHTDSACVHDTRLSWIRRSHFHSRRWLARLACRGQTH